MKSLNKKHVYYFLYTLLFIICCLITFKVYFENGLSFIYAEDGWTQHYKALIYYSRYLRQILENIFVNHTFVIPQWDFSIAEGAGILETFHYYAIGDPIAFLSVFVPEQYIYIYYNFSVLLRMYLSGIAFSEMCFYFKKDNYYAVMAGTITYAFCFWNLFDATRHLYFLNPSIYFPLIIIGIEKIINNEKPYLFTITVLISCLSNFYFFYNIVILTVIYVAVRLLVLYKKDFKAMFYKVLIIFKYAVIAVLMGAIIFLPVVSVFLSDTRAGVTFENHLVYPLTYYKKLISSYFSTSRYGWLCLGFASPTILAIFSSLKDIKKHLEIFIYEIICAIFILIPIFGKIFNGNTYIANKWSFAFSLLVAYILVEEWDNIKKNKILVSIFFVCLSVMCLIGGSKTNVNVPLTISLIFLILIFINKDFNIKGIKVVQVLMIGLIAFNVCFIGNWHYSGDGSNSSWIATTYEQDANIFSTGEAYAMSNYIDENDNEFCRYSGSDLSINASVLFGKSATSYFWSLSNGNVSRYRNDLGMNEYCLYKYNEFDKRFVLYSLSNVKYYVTPEEYNGLLPYGFTYESTVDGYDIYINNNELPFGYTYEDSISYDAWNELSSVEKELVLTKYCVVEDSTNNKANINVNNIPYEIVSYSGLTIEDGEIIINEENAKLSLSFDAVENDSTYISFSGLGYKTSTPWLQREYPEKERTNIIISTDSITKSQALYGNNDRLYNGRSEFTLYLGDELNGTTNLELTFEECGTYSLSNIQISSYSPETAAENLNNLKQEYLENIAIDTNCVSGTIDLSSDKYLLLSIPYSNGWTAYVDGNKVELLNANDAYCALNLTSGHHTIELRYQTPLLKVGACVSLIGTILFVADIIYRKKKNV